MWCPDWFKLFENLMVVVLWCWLAFGVGIWHLALTADEDLCINGEYFIRLYDNWPFSYVGSGRALLNSMSK